MLTENLGLVPIIDDRRLYRAKNEGLGLVPKLLGADSPARIAGSGINLDQIAKGREDWVGGALRQPMTRWRKLGKWKLEVRALGFLDDGEGAGAPTNFFIPRFPEVTENVIHVGKPANQERPKPAVGRRLAAGALGVGCKLFGRDRPFLLGSHRVRATIVREVEDVDRLHPRSQNRGVRRLWRESLRVARMPPRRSQTTQAACRLVRRDHARRRASRRGRATAAR